MKFTDIFKRSTRSNTTPVDYSDPKEGNSYLNNSVFFGDQISRGNMSLSAVYRATEIISDSIAVLPIKVSEITGSGHKDEMTAHPLMKILNYLPGNKLSKYNLMKLLIQSVILKGNGFAYIERKGGKVTGLRFLESGDVTVNYDKNRNTLSYNCAFIGPNKIDPKDMIHLIKNTYDGINGLSVISFASRSIGLSNASEDSASTFFASGCYLSGIVKLGDKQYTQKQREDARNAWENAFSGGAKGGRAVAFLPPGYEYQSISVNAKDAQLIETRQYNVQDIARFFGISPVLLGDLSKTSYNTIEAVQLDFLSHTLSPYIKMVEDEFTRKLGIEDNLLIALDDTFILKSDKSTQASYYTQLTQHGILTVNEARKELGYAEVEGGDELIISYTDIIQNSLNQNKTDDGKDETTETI